MWGLTLSMAPQLLGHQPCSQLEQGGLGWLEAQAGLCAAGCCRHSLVSCLWCILCSAAAAALSAAELDHGRSSSPCLRH